MGNGGMDGKQIPSGNDRNKGNDRSNSSPRLDPATLKQNSPADEAGSKKILRRDAPQAESHSARSPRPARRARSQAEIRPTSAYASLFPSARDCALRSPQRQPSPDRQHWYGHWQQTALATTLPRFPGGGSSC